MPRGRSSDAGGSCYVTFDGLHDLRWEIREANDTLCARIKLRFNEVIQQLAACKDKEENLSEDMISLKNELTAKLDTKVDNVAWKEANNDSDAAIKTVRDMVSSLRLDVDALRRKVDEILATVRHDITAVETNLEESKSKLAMDADHAMNSLNGGIDFTNKDLSAT